MSKKGFTLIEIMVAVSIFSIVAVIVSGALITAMSINRQAQSTKLVVDNLRFALDSIVMRLKDGEFYNCVMSNTSNINVDNNIYFESFNNCDPGGEGIVFTSKRKSDEVSPGVKGRVAFRLIERVIDGIGNVGAVQIASQNGSGFVDMTSQEIDVEALNFYVLGYPLNRAEKVIITISGKTIGKFPNEFYLETTVAGY